MKIKIGMLLLALVVALIAAWLVSCAGGEKYRVDYCGIKDMYGNAKDSYRAGTEVTLYFDLIATDTDYSFYLDGERIRFEYDEKKGFVIRFTMPEHDVKLECETVGSMLPYNGSF